jgi:hypothetical protein
LMIMRKPKNQSISFADLDWSSEYSDETKTFLFCYQQSNHFNKKEMHEESSGGGFHVNSVWSWLSRSLALRQNISCTIETRKDLQENWK